MHHSVARRPDLARRRASGSRYGRRLTRVRRRITRILKRWQARMVRPRRREPFRRHFGSGSGQCVDRFYIERFLAAHQQDIHGRVLEIGDDLYTRKFGGDRVTKSDVLHILQGTEKATIVADLVSGDGITSDAFDCVILTQTLQFIFDHRAAIATIQRILKPGGVLLATVPGITQISRNDMDQWGEYWRYTSLSLRLLLEEQFPREGVQVEGHGNVLAAVAFLHGFVTEEVPLEDIEGRDRDYEVIVSVRAVKPTGNSPHARETRVLR
jgi:SAM-dependent methyltransferase